MTCFEATHSAEAVVPHRRMDVWDVLQRPDLLAELTPLVDRIETSGNLWRWYLAGLSALGVSVMPSFTVRMTFDEGRHIWFRHAPQEGRTEQAGADGEYHLTDHPDGCHLATSLTVRVELPLPRLARGAVLPIMRATVRRQGEAFGDNLLDHLARQHQAA